MKKIELTTIKQNNIDAVRYDFNIGDVYDDRAAEKAASLNNIIPFKYSDEDGRKTITFYARENVNLTTLYKSTLTKKEVFSLINSLATVFEIGSQGIPVSYIVKDSDYVYVDKSNYTVKCLLLPIKQDVMPMAEMPVFFREVISNIRYSENDKDNYVAAMLTLINSDDFSFGKLKEWIGAELEKDGMFISKEGNLTDMSVGEDKAPQKNIKVNKLGVMANMQNTANQMAGQPMMGQPMMGQPMPQQMAPQQPMQPKPMMGQPMPQQMAPQQPMQPKPMMGQPMPQQMAPQQPMQPKPMMGQPMPQQMAPQQPMQPKPMMPQPMQPKPMMGQPMPQQMTPQQPMQPKPMMPQPMPKAASQPAPQPVPQPMPKAAPQPVPQPMPKAAPQPVPQPVPNPVRVDNIPPVQKTQNGLVGQLGSKPVPHIVRKKTGEVINITKTEFSIGKSKTKADYAIADNTAISRVHCIIVQKDGVNYIKDNNSTNHTYINGVELQPGKEVLLKNKTMIQMGDEEFTFLLRKGE